MNVENEEKWNVTTQNSLVVKSCIIMDLYSDYYITEIEKLDFHLPHVYILGKITVQVNGMAYLWVNTINTTSNAHVIMHKYVRF